MASVGTTSSHRGVGSMDMDHSTGTHRSSGDRHGTAERGGRERDRHRPRSTPPGGHTQFVRFNAVGPEETMDWLAALDTVTNRLDTLERLVRLHAESVTNQNKEAINLRTGCTMMAKDIDLYKQYNQHRFKTVEKVVDKMASVVTDFESVHFPQLSANVQTTNAMVESLVDVVSKLRDGPHTYDVATPVEARGRLSAPAGGIEPPGLQGHGRPLEQPNHATLDRDPQPYASGPPSNLTQESAYHACRCQHLLA